jgi:branched-chain amino acid transport system substrate-binding protein
VVDWFAPAPKVSPDFIEATKIKKEVKMRRIAFLLIATLLVMGLVLPGCGGGGGGGADTRPPITFAIADAMTDITGENAWDGATMAQDEINAGLGVNVGGVYHKIALVKVDTNEVNGTPDQGVTALQSVIDDVDFVLGGFRTESLTVYREVAMDAQKLFMDCGAATMALTYSVAQDYDTYKYFFRVTPYNDGFLVTSCFKMTSAVGTALKNDLIAEGDAVNPDYQVTAESKLRVAILMENLSWCAGMVDAAKAYLPAYGFSVVGTWLVGATDTDISTTLASIAAAKPHIIFTAFSGPVGAVYSKQKAELGIPAMTIGINVPGTLKAEWTNTDGKCQGEVILDTWAEGMATGPKAVDFFNNFVTKFGDYPGYTAMTYDEIYALKAAIEAVSAANGYTKIADVIKPANIDHLIQYLETTKWTGGVSYPGAYYPMPAIDMGAGKYALSEAQVRALYPSLGTYSKTGWMAYSDFISGQALDAVAHLPHDVVYGPGYATGIGVQWQNGHKVGIWPMDLGSDYDAALTDQYGNWNFQYPGTAALLIPIDGFLAS